MNRVCKLAKTTTKNMKDTRPESLKKGGYVADWQWRMMTPEAQEEMKFLVGGYKDLETKIAESEEAIRKEQSYIAESKKIQQETFRKIQKAGQTYRPECFKKIEEACNP